MLPRQGALGPAPSQIWPTIASSMDRPHLGRPVQHDAGWCTQFCRTHFLAGEAWVTSRQIPNSVGVRAVRRSVGRSIDGEGRSPNALLIAALHMARKVLRSLVVCLLAVAGFK